MKIHLPSYPPGIHRIEETVEPQTLELDPAMFGKPIDVLIRLDRHDPYLQCAFDLRTLMQLECDRCLTIFDYPLQVRAPMLYVLGRPSSPETLDDPEISYIPATATDIDVSTDLRDFLILGIPERHLHSEECKGLCPQCGVDLNVQTCEHVST